MNPEEIDSFLKKTAGISTGVDVPVRGFVPSGSLALDWAISGKLSGGGMPIGRIVELFGDPSTGKSLLLMHILANTQKAGGIALYDDVEGRFDRFFAEKVGVDVSKLYFLEYDNDTAKTVEGHFEKVEELLKKIREKDSEILVTVAIDSLAALSTRHEVESDWDKLDMFKAKLIHKGMRKLGGRFSKQNVLYMVSNQTIANVGVMYGPKSTTPGGGGTKFQASVRLELSRGKLILGVNEKKVGTHTKIEVVKNSVAPPFKEVEIDISWATGVDRLSGMFEVLVEEGVIVQSGSWWEYKEKKYRQDDLMSQIEEILKDAVGENKTAV